MKNYLPSTFRSTQPELPKKTKIVIDKSVSNSERIFVTPYDKNSSSSKSELEAEELFSAFTANIIKKETIFTR